MAITIRPRKGFLNTFTYIPLTRFPRKVKKRLKKEPGYFSGPLRCSK